MTTSRTDDLQNWVKQQLTLPAAVLNLAPLAGDASFRRYFRLTLPTETLIVVDAPPAKENSHTFVAVARAFAQAGLKVPELHAYDFQQGFMLLSDFGDQLYLSILNEQTVDRLYQQALGELFKIQCCPLPQAPLYDRLLLEQEMQLVKGWFLQKHLGLQLTMAEENMLQQIFTLLTESALNQPQLNVHRDYHSRNLMVLKNNETGILDFQDAVIGPITYDLVSLLRDCYIAWPQSRVEQWALDYQQHAVALGILKQNNPEQFLHWFDWMGLQRHLKCLGIFARKYHRDCSTAYLIDLPRVLQYIIEVTQRYSELAALHQFFQARVLPVFRALEIAA